MLSGPQNKKIQIGDTDMYYVSFGHGKKPFVILPGLGDGLKTVKGLALPLSIKYKELLDEFKIYSFSRKNQLPEGYTTRDMARDQAEAMRLLGIEHAHLMGISMGGMISQYMAIDYPELVDRLVLVVTLSEPNPVMDDSIEVWLDLAEKGEFQHLMTDTARRMYTEAFFKRNEWMLPVTGVVGEPKSYDRYLVMAKACRVHNAYEELDKIKAPTLVIGGELDATLGGDPSRRIAEKIPSAELYMYEAYGHGLYEECKDFETRVKEFLLKEIPEFSCQGDLFHG